MKDFCYYWQDAVVLLDLSGWAVAAQAREGLGLQQVQNEVADDELDKADYNQHANAGLFDREGRCIVFVTGWKRKRYLLRMEHEL